MPSKTSLKLAVVDDHKLFRKGLINLIELVNPNTQIVVEADNGLDLQKKIDRLNLPDIVLMDVNMPGMDGFATMQWLKNSFPEVRVLVVSMIEREETIVKMMKLGVRGYLCKDVEPAELGEALHAVMNKGFYYTDFVTGKLLHAMQVEEEQPSIHGRHLINEREREFMQFACSELTYQEIADKMFLSPKTIDGYRSALFEKLNVKSRVGLVLYAIRHGLVKL